MKKSKETKIPIIVNNRTYWLDYNEYKKEKEFKKKRERYFKF